MSQTIQRARALEGIMHHFSAAGLLEYLNDMQVTELMLNPDGQLWIERHGESMQKVSDVSPDNATRLLNALSDYHKQTVTESRPILECEVPLDGSRFEGLVPPLVANPSFVIRKKATRIFTLDDYVHSGALPEPVKAQLIALIRAHRNIVVVGGTGSGKTTFVNALLHQISVQCPHERLVMLEDTHELQCFAPNHVIKRTHLRRTSPWAPCFAPRCAIAPTASLSVRCAAGKRLSCSKRGTPAMRAEWRRFTPTAQGRGSRV
ncbi:conjugative transfer protein TrbB [Vibrio astriarenae]|nr:conjugative transfer protein TrbB [Vibrio sp. C7]